MTWPGTVRALALVCCWVGLVACASSKSGADIDASTTDAALNDGTPLDGNACAGVTCPGLTFCKEGTCVPFPACPVDGGIGGPDPLAMCAPGSTCRNGVCIPDAIDLDADGYPASTDCDEQNNQVHPGATELCNGVDDDCVMGADDGDAQALCAADPNGEVCVSGACGCLPGHFDLDPAVPKCECVAAPAIGAGDTCGSAIDLGQVVDTGQMRTEIGNIPNGRTVWYRFRGVDATDLTCDNFHVRAALTANPTDQFRIRAFRGDCATALTPAGQFTIVEQAEDFRQTIAGQLTGECPCWSGTPVDNVSPCSDFSADYFVVVERLTGGTTTCASYGVEFSNGIYDTP
jgi:Putative metal-binding motif